MASIRLPLAAAALAAALSAPGHANSQLGSLINACSFGNMRACQQANSLSAQQAAARGPQSAGQLTRRFNYMNNMNKGYSGRLGTSTDVYRHYLVHGY